MNDSWDYNSSLINGSGCVNLSDDCNNLEEEYSSKMITALYVCLQAINIIFTIFISFGNGLVLASFIYFNNLRTPANTATVSLAVADLFGGLIMSPSITIIFYAQSILSRQKYPCLFSHATYIFWQEISWSSILLIAVDRYVAVTFPQLCNHP